MPKEYPAEAGRGGWQTAIRGEARRGAIRHVVGKLSAAYIMRVFRKAAGVKN